jgi:hypothetical protein
MPRKPIPGNGRYCIGQIGREADLAFDFWPEAGLRGFSL